MSHAARPSLVVVADAASNGVGDGIKNSDFTDGRPSSFQLGGRLHFALIRGSTITLQRMLMFSRKVHHLRHLRFSYLVSIDPAFAYSVMMNSMSRVCANMTGIRANPPVGGKVIPAIPDVGCIALCAAARRRSEIASQC